MYVALMACEVLQHLRAMANSVIAVGKEEENEGEQEMRSTKIAIQLVLPVLILGLVSIAFGQAANSPSQSRETNKTTQTRTVSDSEQIKIEGIVTKRDGNVLTLVGSDQKETVVVFTPETKFKLVR